MLKTDINKTNKKQTIEATGSIPELLNDLAVLLGGIHTQFKAVSPAAAELFRRGVQNMVADPNGFVWKSTGSQTGIAIQLPDDREG